MSRLDISIRQPTEYNRQYEAKVKKDIQTQLNNLSEGMIAAKTNATTAAPTTGTYAVGDFVANSAPSELGTAGSKYIVTGWICSATPNTFLQARVLTGN